MRETSRPVSKKAEAVRFAAAALRHAPCPRRRHLPQRDARHRWQQSFQTSDVMRVVAAAGAWPFAVFASPGWPPSSDNGGAVPGRRSTEPSSDRCRPVSRAAGQTLVTTPGGAGGPWARESRPAAADGYSLFRWPCTTHAPSIYPSSIRPRERLVPMILRPRAAGGVVNPSGCGRTIQEYAT